VRSLIRELAPGAGAAPRRRRWVTPIVVLAGAAVFAVLIRTHGTEFLNAVERALHTGWQLVAVAAALEAASIAGYVLLLHRVVSRARAALRMKDSYDITLGGSAAMRLLPTAGLGGAAVTIWALRAHGVRGREIGERLLAFMLLIYGVYMSALLAAGAAVASGLVPVSTGRSLGILGAAVAIAVTASVLILFAAPARLAGALGATGRRSPRLRAAAEQLPVLRAALQRAWLELRRAHPALLGAVAWWGFDLGVLATMLHAFGVKLPIVAVVLAYFLGTLLNVVPLPGSLSGGLAGALIALGSPVGGAIAAVLAYRAIAVWLPAVPGLLSLGSLRKSVAVWRAADAGVAPPAHARSPVRPFASRGRQCMHGFRQLQGATNVAN
jgi:uncharacterized membrane protein YbhN (UPF0104 family)